MIQDNISILDDNFVGFLMDNSYFLINKKKNYIIKFGITNKVADYLMKNSYDFQKYINENSAEIPTICLKNIISNPDIYTLNEKNGYFKGLDQTLLSLPQKDAIKRYIKKSKKDAEYAEHDIITEKIIHLSNKHVVKYDNNNFIGNAFHNDNTIRFAKLNRIVYFFFYEDSIRHSDNIFCIYKILKRKVKKDFNPFPELSTSINKDDPDIPFYVDSNSQYKMVSELIIKNEKLLNKMDKYVENMSGDVDTDDEYDEDERDMARLVNEMMR